MMLKGLLKSAIRDPNPVIFLENEILYNDKSASSRISDQLIPIGKAKVLLEGSDVTLVSYGIGIKHSLSAVELARDINISVELIDLESIRPIDYETVFESIKKTNRCITVEECFPICSIGIIYQLQLWRVYLIIWVLLLSTVMERTYQCLMLKTLKKQLF